MPNDPERIAAGNPEDITWPYSHPETNPGYHVDNGGDGTAPSSGPPD
jgi:hypothetical protein